MDEIGHVPLRNAPTAFLCVLIFVDGANHLGGIGIPAAPEIIETERDGGEARLVGARVGVDRAVERRSRHRPEQRFLDPAANRGTRIQSGRLALQEPYELRVSL